MARDVLHLSSNFFLSDLSKALRNSFQFNFSIASAILNEGMVLHVINYYRATILSQSSIMMV